MAVVYVKRGTDSLQSSSIVTGSGQVALTRSFKVLVPRVACLDVGVEKTEEMH